MNTKVLENEPGYMFVCLNPDGQAVKKGDWIARPSQFTQVGSDWPKNDKRLVFKRIATMFIVER